MRFIQVDVFAGTPYLGNPLAVFPDAAQLRRDQMQAIAREMNLSESSFVTRADRDSYDVRIFTPQEELPFAGHPTIGTSWVLRHLGLVAGDQLVQHSAAGETPVRVDDDLVWFTRSGTVGRDLEDDDIHARRHVAAALGIDEREVGLEARELGRPGRLRPAVADAGVAQLLVPVSTVATLASVLVTSNALAVLGGLGAYCFTATQAGRVRARGFFPGLGITEDPATGAAAAALGLYLDDRVGGIDLEITQGVEINRESKIRVRAGSGRVEVGGRCALVAEGALTTLP
jgi:trans-2,3-dihydro-3-hydroxyanthranilate isomerase